jgi:hypothetical protein
MGWLRVFWGGRVVDDADVGVPVRSHSHGGHIWTHKRQGSAQAFSGMARAGMNRTAMRCIVRHSGHTVVRILAIVC